MRGPLDHPRARSRGAVRLRPALRGERGLTWVGFLLLVAVICGGYLAWVWVPVYFERYAVRQVVRDYMNQAIKNPNDGLLVRNMVHKIHALASLDGIDEWGRPARVPAVQLEEGDVRWVRDTSVAPTLLRVSFEYARDVTYPILERSTTKVFSIDLENELVVPDWGPSR